MRKLKYQFRNYTSRKHMEKRRDHKPKQRQEKHKQTVGNADTKMSQESSLRLDKPATRHRKNHYAKMCRGRTEIRPKVQGIERDPEGEDDMFIETIELKQEEKSHVNMPDKVEEQRKMVTVQQS